MALSRTGEFFAKLDAFLQENDYPPLYRHVSDPIPLDCLDDPRALENHFIYPRVGNHPHHIIAEQWLTDFEGGAEFCIRSDGMSVILATLRAAVTKPGKRHLILVRPLYGGTDIAGKTPEEDFPAGTSITYLSAYSPSFLRHFRRALRKDTTAVLCELPGNPSYPIPDVEAMDHILESLYPPATRPILTVDNTSSFTLFHPFRWGADIIAASGTKDFFGESAGTIGYVGISKRFAKRRPAFWKKVEKQIPRGATPGLLESYLTAHFSAHDASERVLIRSTNAWVLATYLEAHPAVARVTYPGLRSYPWRSLAEKYFAPIDGERAYGGMIACYLRGADLETTVRFLLHLQEHGRIPFEASFGGPHTITASPMFLTHRGISMRAYQSCGIAPNLVRISAGREEDPMAIWGPFARSLDAYRASRR